MHRQIILVLFSLMIGGNLLFSSESNISIQSPDGKLELTLSDSVNHFSDSSLSYSISREGEMAVFDSPLGIETTNGLYNASFLIETLEKGSDVDQYQLPMGKRKNRVAVYNFLKIRIADAGTQSIILECRIFNDGAAFRYQFEGEGKLEVLRELTGFSFSEGKKAWMQAYHKAAALNGRPAYERAYSEVLVGSDAKEFPSSNGWCLPALFEQGDELFVLAAESNLDKNYTGCRLEGTPEKGTYRIRFASKKDALYRGKVNPIGQLPFNTSWRVLIIGTAGDIVESTLIDDLGDPMDSRYGSEFPTWIKPGRAVWDWAAYVKTGDFETQKRNIDFAAEMGWEYCLVDANWNKWNSRKPWPLVRELVKYGESKKVDILLWYNSGGPHNIVPEQPRNWMHERKSRREEMKRLHDAGVKGIKVDFFHSDKQDRINQYLEILEDGADFKLLINFHGCTVPRGWVRKYPNLMSMESVYGGEQYSFSGRTGPQGDENNFYLYTRNVVGSMDFTPVILEKYMNADGPTFGHAMAQAVLFESALTHFGSAVNNPNRGYKKVFKQHPEAKSILSTIPTVWDDTLFVAGHPSTHTVLARVKDGAWYVGGFNATDSTMEIEFALDFLSDGNFEAVLVQDGVKEDELLAETTQVTVREKVTVKMLAQGGFILRLLPVK